MSWLLIIFFHSRLQSILCDTACPTEANKVRQKWWTILARQVLEMVNGTYLNVIKCPLFKVHQAEKVRNLHPAWATIAVPPTHKHALDGCSTQHYRFTLYTLKTAKDVFWQTGNTMSGPDSPEKSQLPIGFFRNTGTDPPPSRSNLTLWVQMLLEGGPYGPL